LKVAVVFPAGTVTVAGGVADSLELDRLTTAPPIGAAPVRVTVPVTELATPPVTDDGETVTDDKAAADIVSAA